MDMNRTFFLKKEQEKPAWRLIDAQGKVLGRLATEIADALRGKDKASYTPHADAGDYIVVINAEKIELTGNKEQDKTYEWYTGWMGGLRSRTAGEMRAAHPDRIISLAVRGMLPKNKLSRALMRKLKVYAGAEHPHSAQIKKA